MFSLTVVFGPGPTVWTLLFKEKETAIKALDDMAQATGRFTDIADDFSQNILIDKCAGNIHGFMLEDLEQSRLAHIERALHQARTQAKGSELAEADPVLRQARLKAQGGLGMIQPVPGGMMGANGRFPS